MVRSTKLNLERYIFTGIAIEVFDEASQVLGSSFFSSQK
jgi:hypothetical protein